MLKPKFRRDLKLFVSGKIPHSFLARRLLRFILSLYLGIASIATIAQVAYQYINELDNLQKEIHTTVQLVLPTLAATLWNVDASGVKTVIQSLSQNQAIAGVALESDIPMMIGSASSNSSDITKHDSPEAADQHNSIFNKLYEQSFTIQRADSKGEVLGTLKVYSSAYTVWIRTRNVFFALMVSAFVKTVALWIILYLVVSSLVAFPLKKIAKGLNKINQELFDQKLISQQPVQAANHGDELEFLFRSFVLMRYALKRSHRELLTYQQELEQKIQDRTEQLQYQATHDSLTDLPNRIMFNEVLDMAIRSEQRYQRGFAVLFIDLDRFKVINDTLGHSSGDMLLREMGERFTECLRASDVVARLGGDEFVVLLQEVNEPEQIIVVVRKLLSAIMKPVVILDQECRVTASIGICQCPKDGLDAQTLMKNADIAMYFAKEEGKNNYQFYSKDINTPSLKRLTLETSLRRALEFQEFRLLYQAKLDFKSQQITGVEALLRWEHPELGMVPPLQFIPLAEETGLIVPIGKWVLKTACAQNVAWKEQGLPPLCMAVNLSLRQFMDPNLLLDLADILQETGMDPTLLELEITESMVMHNIDRVIKLLADIKQMGIRLAIDDFGTGYSSLAQLKRFPFDTLKVDRSFIRDLPTDIEDRAITEAIIKMGNSLGLTVIAEGVETKEQETFLREHACNQMQGYYLSKPITANQFSTFLRKHEGEG